MALNNGTRLIAGVVPTDSLDTFATHFSEYGKGGHRTVSGMTELYAITTDRREVGMTVYVSSLLLTYQLVGGITNSNWVIYNSGSGGGTFTGGTVSGSTNFLSDVSGNTVYFKNLYHPTSGTDFNIGKQTGNNGSIKFLLSGGIPFKLNGGDGQIYSYNRHNFISLGSTMLPILVQGYGSGGSYLQTGDLTQWTAWNGTNLSILSVVNKDGYLGLGTSTAQRSLTLGSSASGIIYYNTADQITNTESLSIFKSSNSFYIQSSKSGTGITRDLNLETTLGGSININALGGTAGFIQLGRPAGTTQNHTFVSITPGQGIAPVAGAARALAILPTINNNSGDTGSVSNLWIAPYIQSNGLGTHFLIDAGTSPAASGGGTYSRKFTVDTNGNLNSTSFNILDGVVWKSALNIPTGNTLQIGSGFTTAYLPTNIALPLSAGTNVEGSYYTLSSGQGTGTARESGILFRGPSNNTLTSGTTQQPLQNLFLFAGRGGGYSTIWAGIAPGNQNSTNYIITSSGGANTVLNSLGVVNLAVNGTPVVLVNNTTLQHSGSFMSFGGGNYTFINPSPIGTNLQGGSITLQAASGTGNALPGTIQFKVADQGTVSGSSTQPLVTVLTLGSRALIAPISDNKVVLAVRGNGAAGSYTQSGDLTQWIRYDGTNEMVISKIDKSGNATFPKTNTNILNLINHTPTSINDGDIWLDGSNLKVQISGVIKTINLT